MWRGAEPERPRRARGPPDLRWTVRGRLMLNWTQASGSDAPETTDLTFLAEFRDPTHYFLCIWWYIITTVLPSQSKHYSQESLQLETAVCCDPRAEHQDGYGSLGCLGQEITQLMWLMAIWTGGPNTREKSTLNAEQVLASVHGKAGRVTRWCQRGDIATKHQSKKRWSQCVLQQWV